MNEDKRSNFYIPSRKSIEKHIEELKLSLCKCGYRQEENPIIDSSISTKNPKLYDKIIRVVAACKEKKNEQDEIPTIKTVLAACGFDYYGKDDKSDKQKKHSPKDLTKEDKARLYANKVAKDIKNADRKYALNKGFDDDIDSILEENRDLQDAIREFEENKNYSFD